MNYYLIIRNIATQCGHSETYKSDAEREKAISIYSKMTQDRKCIFELDKVDSKNEIAFYFSIYDKREKSIAYLMETEKFDNYSKANRWYKSIKWKNEDSIKINLMTVECFGENTYKNDRFVKEMK